MGTISSQFSKAFRDYVIDGVASSGSYDIQRDEVRAIGPLIEEALSSINLAALVSTVKATRADLDNDLDYPEDTVALVYGDSLDSNNDLYTKVGISGSGSWTITTVVHDIIGGAISSIAETTVRPLVDLSEEWASNPVDQQISNNAGKYSALHHATKTQILKEEVDSISQTISSLFTKVNKIYIPGIGYLEATSVRMYTDDNRISEYKTPQGDTYKFQNEKFVKISLNTEIERIYIPGFKETVSKVKMSSNNKRISEITSLNGKSYFPGDKGWFTPSEDPLSADVVIYGSSVAGLLAAGRSSLRGCRVALLDPYSNFGGMHASGLMPDRAPQSESSIYGGLLESVYFQGLLQEDPDCRKYFPQSRYAEKVANQIISRYTSCAMRDTQINGQGDVIVEGDQIKGIVTKRGIVKGKVFIDASYEGDLMAAALGPKGYRVGRESFESTGEPEAGVLSTVKFGFLGSAFPYYTGSGRPLTPAEASYLVSDPNSPLGSADRTVQAFNFRCLLTRNPKNYRPLIKPYGYNSRDCELQLQIIRLQNKTTACRGKNESDYGFQSFMSGDKVNWNAMDFPNGQLDYADANWTQREEIIRRHVDRQQSLMWCLANDPITRDYGLGPLQDDWNDLTRPTDVLPSGPLGLCQDEFEGSKYGAGWPWALYIREARRLEAMYMLNYFDQIPPNQSGNPFKSDSIGKWSYPHDIHPLLSFRLENSLTSIGFEGVPQDVETPSAVYQIPARIMWPSDNLPRQINNLIVCWGVGTTHRAWAPQRLEYGNAPVGEAAGENAAWYCHNRNLRVKDIPYPILSSRLREFGSKL